MAKMIKPKTRRVPLSNSEIDHMVWSAQQVMENDSIFAENLNLLRLRINTQKVPKALWRKVRDAIASACLRRNGFAFHHARLALMHGA